MWKLIAGGVGIFVVGAGTGYVIGNSRGQKKAKAETQGQQQGNGPQRAAA